MAINLSMKNVPPFLRVPIVILPSLIILILFVFLIYIPKNKEVKKLNTDIAKLENEIASSEVKVRRLQELIKENKKLKLLLAELKEQLPEEKEVSNLLKQISDLGLNSGLEILLWKPETRKPDPLGLYVEIPVSVEIKGGYHDLGIFFSHISRLRRIVNISNIDIKNTDTRTTRSINAIFTASTFSAVDKSAQVGVKQ